MRILPLLAVALALQIPVIAQLPAALKPHADKFDQDRAALEAFAETQVKPARERYLAVLAAAQKAATAASRTADIAAIASEIDGVGANALTDPFPPDLSKSLAPDRRNYLAAATNVARTVPPRLRDLAAKYLQTLATLDANALRAKDAALIDAIRGEKQRAIGFTEAAGGGQKNRNLLANGDFSQGDIGGRPPGWKDEAGDVSVTDASVVTDGNERFLRFRRLQALRRANCLPEREIVVPARAKWVEFSVKIRVKGLVPGKEYHMHPGVHVTARDARGEELGGKWAAAKQDGPWKRYTERFQIPPNTKTVRFALGPFGAAGIVDFDDTELEFK